MAADILNFHLCPISPSRSKILAYKMLILIWKWRCQSNLNEKSTTVKIKDASGRHFEFSCLANANRNKTTSVFASCKRRNCVPVKRWGRSHPTARLADANDITIPMETTVLAQLGQATLPSLPAQVGGPTSMASRYSAYNRHYTDVYTNP